MFRRMVVSALVLAALFTTPGRTVVASSSGSFEFDVSSASVEVTGLVFVGVFVVESGSTSLSVMRFTADAVGMDGARWTSPCQSSFATTISVPAGSTALLTGPVRVDASAIQFTYAGAQVVFTAASPPPAGFAVPAGTLTNVEIIATTITATRLSLPNSRMTVVAC